MSVRSRYRQLFLFLIALIIPSLAGIVLGLRMVTQERELGEKRLVDAQRRSVSEIRQEMLARLERIKVQAVSGNSDPSIALVATAERDRLVLPWDADPDSE